MLDFDAEKPNDLDCWLLSQNTQTLWDGPLMTADEPPTKSNTNGLYAAKAKDSYNLPCLSDYGDARVIGRVGMLGKVVEGERGYRAQQMMVRELWIIDTTIYADFKTQVSLAAVKVKLAERYQLTDAEIHEGKP